MRPSRFATQLLLITIAAIIVSVVWQSIPLIEAELLGRRAEPREVTARGDLAADERATIELFEARKDSVVYISTSERVIDPWTRSIHDMPRGTGSGFLWDRLGHVITNRHVVAGASGAYIRLADGRVFAAHLVGVDSAHDLAVLRIAVPTGRPDPLPIGRSSDLVVGQKVFAIGNPFGLDWTLTTGIVSALERELPAENGTIRGLIQTDAAINPGNSGGPLLDSAGRLIGVNTAIFSPSGAYAGIGFAVPVDAVNRVVPQLIRRGHYAPPTLGLKVDARADSFARRNGVSGVLILQVLPDSPASQAGLQAARIDPDGGLDPGDVIIGVDGQEITTTEALLAALDRRQAGDKVSLSVLRDGSVLELEMVLEAGS